VSPAPVTRAAGSPLRIAALVKQVPVAESMRLEGGRLVRRGVGLEMNAYCRRAVSQGVILAGATGGSCTVVTLGPPSAEDVLREAVAWGADSGVHVCDEVFGGSDTLATARALAAALRAAGPFDLVLLGRNSIDGETGQVGPEIAELLDLPFATGVRRLEDLGTTLRLELELDDGTQEAEIALPAVLTVAERLCDPCKVDPEGRAAVPAERLTRLGATVLGRGPWGEAGSPTVVGETRSMDHARANLVLEGPVDEQVREAVRELHRRGALDARSGGTLDAGSGGAPPPAPPPAAAEGNGRAHRLTSPVIAVLIEPGRPQVAAELLGAAARLGHEAGAVVHALVPIDPAGTLPATPGADRVVALVGSCVAEDVGDAVVAYVREACPWAVLAPSTAFGREVAGRAAAATGSGLVGDAIALSARAGVLVAAKPAFAGALVADITCRSATQMVTVRPGVLPAPEAATPRPVPPSTERVVGTRGRVRVLAERHDDDVETLARAQVVIGVGAGVEPEEYGQLSPLAALLGAELAATRKVTDRGWAPRARQVGLTGRSIAPRLYIGLGLSGKFNHAVGVRAAGTILAVNTDPGAPVFAHCDVGIVGDWREVVPLLHGALRTGGAGDTGGAGGPGAVRSTRPAPSERG
jgi:electron transfer flavoprotein alpha subunit